MQMFVSFWINIKKMEKFLAKKHLVCVISLMIFFFFIRVVSSSNVLRPYKLTFLLHCCIFAMKMNQVLNEVEKDHFSGR